MDPCQQRDTDGERVWGAAYHIIHSKAKETKEYLDIREINGYSVQYTTFHATSQPRREFRCLVYIGMPDNPQFLGALAPQAVAERINQSVGPSGENRDYLLQLEESLRDLSKESSDAHISDLARRVSNMEHRPGEQNRKIRSFGPHKTSSTEEQEEVENESQEALSRDHGALGLARVNT